MRFTALDALRGICALIVVIFHIEIIGEIYAGSMHGVPFFEHGFLFVDFFFVLSGFVLTHSYFSRINNVTQLKSFIIRRLGRVYPLHILFLALFIAMELIKYFAYLHGAHTDQIPFTKSYSIPAIFTNILLIQSLGIHSSGTWNDPSWSISVEFYTYIVFALCVFFLHQKKFAFTAISAGIAALSACIVLYFSKDYMDSTYDYGIFRCLYGFFCGAITYILTAKIRGKIIAPAWIFSIAEIAILLTCIVFVSNIGMTPSSLISPLIFSIAVTIFSFERGIISLPLTKRPFQFLGDISYTLYISHAFILVLARRIFRVLEKKTHYFSTIPYHFRTENMDLLVLLSRAVSNILVVGILVVIVVMCAIVYRWIEIPCRDYFGRIAKRMESADRAKSLNA
jgi:peptidoglycan/LPS O-acetylase OafA/YrhL